MNPETLSDQIVAAASVVLGGACLAMVSGAFVAWRTKPRNRAQTDLADMSQQFRAVADRLQPAEGPVRKGREIPSA